eukprot:1580592-Amphidinium_carterae.1
MAKLDVQKAYDSVLWTTVVAALDSQRVPSCVTWATLRLHTGRDIYLQDPLGRRAEPFPALR